MKKFVRFFSLCTLILILCCSSALMVACTDEPEEIVGNYTFGSKYYVQITFVPGGGAVQGEDGYRITRISKDNQQKTFENFQTIHKENDVYRYIWRETEPFNVDPEAPQGTFQISIYPSKTETGKWAVQQVAVDQNYLKTFHVLEPTEQSLDEWLATK